MPTSTARIRIALATLLALAALGTSPTRAAHPPESDDTAPRAYLYERPHFRGAVIEVQAGESLRNLASVRFPNGRRANDAVGSILVEPGALVVVYADSKFRGEVLHLRRSVENLNDLQRGTSATWAATISSVQVEIAPRGSGRGRRHDNEPRIILFRDANFRGDYLEVFPGESFENLNKVSFEGSRNANDAISSIRVIGPVRVRLYSAAGFREDEFETAGDVPDLARLPRPGHGRLTWNDCISSLQVERAGRPDGRDGRGGHRPPPREDFSRTIRDLHQQVLGRDCTPGELQKYQRLMVDQGWTAAIVRADLEGSDEYRRKAADQVIFRAYQDLLGRQPDPDGLAHYRGLMLERNWTEERIRNDIRSSPEYKARESERQQPPPPPRRDRSRP